MNARSKSNKYDHAWINDCGVVMGTKSHYDPNKDPKQPEESAASADGYHEEVDR